MRRFGAHLMSAEQEPGFRTRFVTLYRQQYDRHRDFMRARVPNVDPANFAAGYGYMVAQALIVVLEQCKNDLSRENIMAQAANLKDVSLPLLMTGVKLNTSPKDYRPIKDGYMVEFRDSQFNVISELLRGS